VLLLLVARLKGTERKRLLRQRLRLLGLACGNERRSGTNTLACPWLGAIPANQTIGD
jgi:hypothetical protein